MVKALRSLPLVVAAALAILALNLWVLAPALTRSAGPLAGNGLYITLGIATLVALSFVLVRFQNRNRFQALSTTALVAFVDHAVFKSLMLYGDFRSNPAAWQGSDFQATLFGVLQGYMAFLPMILIFAFLGSELGKIRRALPS